MVMSLDSGRVQPKDRSFDIQMDLEVELLLLCVQRASGGGLGIIRMPPGRLPLEGFWAFR